MSYTSGNATEITDYTYDANNRLTSETNSIGDNIKSAIRYYYDNNGNTTSEQKTVYTTGTQKSNMRLSGRSGGSTLKLYRYDEFNRLVQYNDDGAEAVYTYGVDNLRASKTVNGTKTTYAWNGQNLAEETTHGTTTVYAYDVTGVISSRADNDSAIRYIKDPHGSVVATSKGGELYGTYDYTAFGNQLESTDTTNPFRYCGEYYDDESGLTYLRNRYYNSTTGRFISEDPIRDGANWYVYGNNNPVVFVDPWGLEKTREGLPNPYDFKLMGQYIMNVVQNQVLWSVSSASEKRRRHKEANDYREKLKKLVNKYYLGDGIQQLLTDNIDNGDINTVEQNSAMLVVIAYCIDEMNDFQYGKDMDLSYSTLSEIYEKAVNSGNLYYYQTENNSDVINRVTQVYLGTDSFQTQPGGTYKYGEKQVANAFNLPFGAEELDYIK